MSRRRRMDKSSGTDFKNIELVCFLACIHILETLKDVKFRYFTKQDPPTMLKKTEDL